MEKRFHLPMDVHKALRELYQEKKRLDAAITTLEGRMRAPARLGTARARGRKQMSAEERLEVSKRMKKYWEARRAQSRALETATSTSNARRTAGGASA
jgi:hypothetical protein